MGEIEINDRDTNVLIERYSQDVRRNTRIEQKYISVWLPF